jgi:fumarylpyruvate hydrolase
MTYVFAPGEPASATVEGRPERFPVHRIYCVGRNYAAHAREMGKDPDREPPFFFTKPADAVVASDEVVPYPPRTQNFHHEVELVVALGSGGRDMTPVAALECVFGYAIGIDWTRRDLQFEARDKGRPWDTGKAFDRSASIGAIRPVAAGGHIQRGAIRLAVNGEVRQQGDVADLIWSVPDLLAELSTLFELRRGDLIYTGTPAGVGAVRPGDRIQATIDGLPALVATIGEAR